MSVGMPQTILLQRFGDILRDAFGQMPYHVGSSVREKIWRDVDVRVLLPDDEYKAMGLGTPDREQHNPKWVALCLAFSALGKTMTGLPVDFQIQQLSYANEKFPTGRSALFSLTQLNPQEEP